MMRAGDVSSVRTGGQFEHAGIGMNIQMGAK